MAIPYFSINIILLSTLSIVDLNMFWSETYHESIYDDYYWERYYLNESSRWRVGDLWPLGAGLWPVPITFALLIGMIRCQQLQQTGQNISRTITVIKALVSSIQRTDL